VHSRGKRIPSLPKPSSTRAKIVGVGAGFDLDALSASGTCPKVTGKLVCDPAHYSQADVDALQGSIGRGTAVFFIGAGLGVAAIGAPVIGIVTTPSMKAPAGGIPFFPGVFVATRGGRMTLDVSF
jgi:hypothetical protein